MLQSSTRKINVEWLIFFSRAIGTINFIKSFSKFYYELILKYNVRLKALLRDGLSKTRI